MKNEVVIIIPVLDQLLYTKRLLESIKRHKFTTFDTLRVVVVDNGSKGDTKEFLKEWLSSPVQVVVGEEHVKADTLGLRYVITNEDNKGFAPAVNQGIDFFLDDGDSPNFLIMNNDMELIDGCLDALYTTAYEKEDIGIVGGKLLFSDGRIQHGGAFLNVLGWGQHTGGGIQGDNKFFGAEKRECEYVTGALFFIKADVFLKTPLCGFDDRFAPAYFEEVDFCYAAREHGFKTVYTPDAKAYHFENTTGKELYGNAEDLKKALSDKNQIKFYLKQEEAYKRYSSSNEQKLLMVCQIYGDWSFAIVMRNLAKGFARNGVDVSIASEEYHNLHAMEDWEIKQLINKPNDYWNRAVMRSSEGDHMYLMPPGRKRIAHTTGENSRVSAMWVDQLNHTDMVLTTSTFFQNVLHKGGVNVPIHVLPNSVDVTKYNLEVERAQMNREFRSVNFFSMFAWGERKNPDALFKAFIEEFGPEDDVTLTVHSLSMEFVLSHAGLSIKEYIQRLAGGKKHAPIFVTSKSLHEVVIPNFMRNFDVNVLTTRGEGFGNSVLECAAVGIPSIVTAYSGVTDFVKEHEEVGWLVDYDLVDIPLQKLPYFRNYIGGRWAEINIEALRSRLRYVANNKHLIKKFGQNAHRKAQNYSIEKVGALATSLIFEE